MDGDAPSRNATLARRCFVSIGVFFLALAAWVARTGVWVSHSPLSRPYESVYEGVDAYWSAAGLACIGIALLGTLFRRIRPMTAWIAIWLTLSVVVPVFHAYAAA
jgi:hypothetical protein